MTGLFAAPQGADWWQIAGIFVGILAAIIVLLLFIFIAKFFNLWIQSITTGAGIGLFDLIGMWLRKSTSMSIELIVSLY